MSASRQPEPVVHPVISYPADLPMSARREEIVAALKAHNTIILAGETGSGKTTQLPKMLVEAGFADAGKIAVTQPRRVAAQAVSRRIAEELKTEWGAYVGCQIRFADRSSSTTRIKVMTDGILLNEIQHDPLLRQYSAVMLDEAHERSLNMDFLIGHFRRIREKRPDLRLIITSATLDLEAFSEAFPGAPVIRVEGRTYPVEVIYRPLDSIREERGEISFTEAAAQTAKDIASTGDPGDMLIFMPTERDIRETVALLEKNGPKPAEILPLFGRLSAADQQRIFAPSRHRKIVVSTNVAETSLTIPGIRFVIDAGLARVSRHNAQTRTQRLPVEPVSQSAANQRKGRCGRVMNGVCFRLYSEEDYNARPVQTEPEILRSNLAGVILRMLAFRLGDIREFPFVNPPQERSIRAGFVQLHELGAIDEEHRLTPMGREMARLPVDPTFARILIQARREQCLREVLVIAAGLSIMDPRERPQENPGQADMMHKPFLHPESDFMTLLRIWDAYHDECENLSLGKLRRFCKEHFLNFMRMQEWRDLHGQLARALEDLEPDLRNEKRETRSEKGSVPNPQSRFSNLSGRISEAGYDSIHRCILSGLLGNVARLDKDGVYLATHARKAALFPGSSLAKGRRGAEIARLRRKSGDPAPDKAPKLPEWIVCAGWMETSRLFARTVARVNPSWILDLGRHLLTTTHTEPHWDEKGCRAVIKERVRLYGLEVATNSVGYVKFDAEAATDMFIANALVPDACTEHFEFLDHNREILATVEDRLMRLRKFSAAAIDERLTAFYAARITAVGSVGDLRNFCRENRVTETRLLHLTERDLGAVDEADAAAFPSSVTIGSQEFPLAYRQAPGGAEDGVTLKLPAELYSSLPGGFLDWLVPGYLPERIETMLRKAPKEARVALFPIAEKVAELLRDLKPDTRLKIEDWLAGEVRKRWNVVVFPRDLASAEIPERLIPRLELADAAGKAAGAARDLGSLRDVWQTALEKKAAPPVTAGRALARAGDAGEPAARALACPAAVSPAGDLFSQLRVKYEVAGLKDWTFPDLPESIPAGTAAGTPIFAWPGLAAEQDGVAVRLFRSRDEAESATAAGVIALAEHMMKPDLSGIDYALSKDLKSLHLLWLTLGTGDQLLGGSKRILRRHLLLHAQPPLLPLTKAGWDARLREARLRTTGIVAAYLKTLKTILEQRDFLCSAGEKAYAGATMDVVSLLYKDFLDTYSYAEFPRILRWLRGRMIRRERSIAGPFKDAEKAMKLNPYRLRAEAFAKLKPVTGAERALLAEFRRLMEEYRISIFAPEVGTEGKVSPAVLDAHIAEICKHFRVK